MPGVMGSWRTASCTGGGFPPPAMVQRPPGRKRQGKNEGARTLGQQTSAKYVLMAASCTRPQVHLQKQEGNRVSPQQLSDQFALVEAISVEVQRKSTTLDLQFLGQAATHGPRGQGRFRRDGGARCAPHPPPPLPEPVCPAMSRWAQFCFVSHPSSNTTGGGYPGTQACSERPPNIADIYWVSHFVCIMQAGGF